MKRGHPTLVLAAMIAVVVTDDSFLHAIATVITLLLAIDAGGRLAFHLMNKGADKIEEEEKREEKLDIFR